MAQLGSSLGLLIQANVFSCLAFCYLLFVLLGGVVFTVVEAPLEKELRAEAEQLRRSFLQDNPCVEESELSELLGKALSAHHSREADEKHDDFISSLYFVILTLTTMGKMQHRNVSGNERLIICRTIVMAMPFNSGQSPNMLNLEYKT